MKEKEIKKKALDILTEKGFVVWFPPKVKFYQTDILGIYDCIAVKKSTILLIQLTSLSNIRAREKKIKTFLSEHQVSLYSEVWGFDEKNNKFKIIQIYGE
jgi:hypothetical protein